MIKNNRKALIDGLISAITFYLLGRFSISIFLSFESLVLELIIILGCIVISSASAIYNLKYRNIREMIKGYLISFVSCVFFLCIIYSNFAH